MKYRDQNPVERKDLADRLSKCNSLGEMLSLLQSEYKLEEIRLGITKGLYVNQFITLLNSFNPSKK